MASWFVMPCSDVGTDVSEYLPAPDDSDDDCSGR